MYPSKIIDGEIVEHKMAFDMQLNHLENSKDADKSIKIAEVVTIPIIAMKCGCGVVFKYEGTGIDICDTCFDKFDDTKHYLKVKQRNERRNK